MKVLKMKFQDFTGLDVKRLTGQTMITSAGVILDKGDVARRIADDLARDAVFFGVGVAFKVAKSRSDDFPAYFFGKLDPILIEAYQKRKYEAGLEAPDVDAWQENYVRENRWRKFPTVDPAPAQKKRRKKAA